MNNRKIKSYFINWQFQKIFILYCLIANIVLSLCFFLSAYSFFRGFETKGRSAGFPEDHVFFSFIAKQEYSLYFNMLLSFVIVSIIALIAGTLMSHKIAGPVLRLIIEFEKMKEKKGIHKIAFRKKDYFQEIPTAFNEMVDTIEK